MKLIFTDLFNILLDNVKKPDGSKHMLIEVAHGTGISEQNLGLYKRGKRDKENKEREKNKPVNPSIETVSRILQYFGIPMAYLDSESELDAIQFIHKHLNNENLLAQARFRNTQEMDLSPTARGQVMDLISWVVKKELAEQQGLPQPPLPEFKDKDEDNS